jgi:hypothetical protein
MYPNIYLWVTLTAEFVLTLLGAIVALQEEWAKQHRWPILMAFFLFGLAGMTGAIKTSQQAAVAEARLSESIKELGDSSKENGRIASLNTELQQRLLQQSPTIAALSRENISTAIGGDSFCYLDLTRLITPEFFVEGKYPLHGVTATITDFGEQKRISREIPIKEHRPPNLQEILAAQAEIQLGEMAPNHGQPLYPVPPLLQKNLERDLGVSFIAFNGFWYEHICLRRATNNVPGGMVLAATTIVSRRGKVIMRHVDENYPKDQPCG